MYLQLLLVILRIIWVYLTWINGYLGNTLLNRPNVTSSVVMISWFTHIGVRGGGGGGAAAPPPPWNCQNSHIRAKKSGNIRAKLLDFRASNGENIRATDLSPPKRNWSRTPMFTHIPTAHVHQCCRFQSYANSHATPYEIYKRNLQSVNRIPGIHDNGPPDRGLWRLTLTAYYPAMVRQDSQDMLHRCQICIGIRGGEIENVGAY